MHDPRRRRIPITGFDRPDRDPLTGRPIRHRPIHAEGDGAQEKDRRDWEVHPHLLFK